MTCRDPGGIRSRRAETPPGPIGRRGLAREIAWLLAVKAVLLFVLWYAFFSAPVAGDHLTAGRVADVIVGQTATDAPQAPAEESRP
jgi:hypothetical protein